MRDARPVGWWLVALAAMIFAMALIGAITRLTESGLSIVEWEPIKGALPPIGEAAWQAEFARYLQSPQGRLVNAGMALADFQAIFFWEWFHRLWGRLIGVVFLVPFLWFLIRRQLPRRLVGPLIGIFLLGGLQGWIGWFMVQSGLVNDPAVSHYRLATHLGAALLLYALVIWTALPLLWPVKPPRERHLVTGLLILLSVTIVWGAFTAGLDAGLVYNSWPLMDGRLLPPELDQGAAALIGNHGGVGGVQFAHRWLAALTTLCVLAVALPRLRTSMAARAATAMVLVQFGLGLVTLLSGVDIILATMHQGGALLLLAVLIAWRRGLGSGAVPG